jgi:hypothetical protein
MNLSTRRLARACLPIGASLIVALVCASGARAAEAPTWRFAPALAPPAPAGVSQAPYAVPVGHVGQISFWAPNRGLLITGGSGPVEAGLYAYNGVDWHQLSTVCGGSEGRIAWAGPDEFWTISDQRGGQDLPPQQQAQLKSISLCHFLDGQVVGSYAMPLDQPGSYQPMYAAACYDPDDCWFAGADGASPNVGAFHLHWNGSTVSVVYAPEDHGVTGMVNFENELYESVTIGAGDIFPTSAPKARTPVIHTIAPVESSPFSDLDLVPPEGSEWEGKPALTLPEYVREDPPWSLEGFTLASNGSALGADATQLWAAANPANYTSEALTVLHCVQSACRNGEWSQITPSEPREVPEGTRIVSAPAPEPESESAWLPLAGYESEPAEVGLLDADGHLEETQSLPGPQEEVEVGDRGTAGPIVCPAAHDCWMATDGGIDSITGKPIPAGWLFHLTNGTQYPQDTDPNFAGVITYRPPDAAEPIVYPDLPPVDDSLINQLTEVSAAPAASPPTSAPKRAKAKPLLAHVKSRFEHKRVLVISFVLMAPAHVQLIGHRRGKVVAHTRDELLGPGPHKLTLTFDTARWPSRVQFNATPLHSEASSAGSGSEGEGTGGPEAGADGKIGNVVSTG